MITRCLLSRIRQHTGAICMRRKHSTKQLNKELTLVVTKEDVDESVDFLGYTFVRNEPLIKAMGIEDSCDLLRYFKKVLSKNGVTLKLINDECDILSIAICTVPTPQTSKETRFFADCNVCDPKTKRLLHLWADIADSYNLFECLNVDELWDITYLATRKEAQGKGFSKLLSNEARLLGKKEGMSIVRMDCTSYFSAKLAESLNFITMPPRNVMTYRDKKGVPWLPKAPSHPHGHVFVAYDFLI